MIKKKNLSQEDKKTWEDYIKDPSDIFDKDKNNKKNTRKERFSFDLHGFSLDNANKKLEKFYFIASKTNIKNCYSLLEKEHILQIIKMLIFQTILEN